MGDTLGFDRPPYGRQSTKSGIPKQASTIGLVLRLKGFTGFLK